MQEIWYLSLQWLLIFLSVVFGPTVEFLFFHTVFELSYKALFFPPILHLKKPIFTYQGPVVVLAKPQNTPIFRHTPRLPTFLWTYPQNKGVVLQGSFNGFLILISHVFEIAKQWLPKYMEIKSVKRYFNNSYHSIFFYYSETSIKWTPWGPSQVSA